MLRLSEPRPRLTYFNVAKAARRRAATGRRIIQPGVSIDIPTDWSRRFFSDCLVSQMTRLCARNPKRNVMAPRCSNSPSSNSIMKHASKRTFTVGPSDVSFLDSSQSHGWHDPEAHSSAADDILHRRPRSSSPPPVLSSRIPGASGCSWPQIPAPTSEHITFASAQRR